MNLRDKLFEKTLRRRVRVELRNSPAAWAEYQRSWPRWLARQKTLPPWIVRCVLALLRNRQTNLPPWLVRCFLVPFLASFLLQIPRPLAAYETALLAVALIVLAWRTGQLWLELGSSSRLQLLAHLPLTDEQVFDLQWRHFLKTSAWSIYDFTVLCAFLAVNVGYGWKSPVTGFALAIGLWLVIVSAAACLMLGKVPSKIMKLVVLTRRRLGRLLLLCLLLAVVYAGLHFRYFHLTSLAPFGAFIPPIGWIFYALGVSPPHDYLLDSWSALSFSTMLFAAPLALRRLRAGYKVPELTNTAAIVAGLIEAERRREDDGSNPDAFAAIKARIRTREFLQEFDWQRAGWVERVAGRWLTPRQRIAAEYLSGGSPAWTRQILRLGLIVCGAAVLGWLFRQFLGFVSIVAFAVVILMQTGKGKGAWPGTSLRQISGSNISLYATYPIGFWQIAGISMKVYLANLTLVLPFLAVAAAAGSVAAKTDWLIAILIAGKTFVVLLAFGIVQPVGLVTGGTNDGTKLRLIVSTVVWAVLAILSFILLVTASSIFTFLLGTVIFLGLCVGALCDYGRAYNHGGFDLQAAPKQTTSARPQ